MKYLTFLLKVLFALCMRYFTMLLYNSYGLFSIFQDCFTNLFYKIMYNFVVTLKKDFQIFRIAFLHTVKICATISLSARIVHRAPPPAPSGPKLSNSENCCGSENAMPPKIFWDMEGRRGNFR